MDIIAWNIQWGGGTRIEAIVAELVRRDAPVLVLGEYQTGTSEPLVRALYEAGWGHADLPTPPGRYGGVAVLSKLALEPRPLSVEMAGFAFRYRAVGIPAAALELRAVYGPLHKDRYQDFWTTLLRDIALDSAQPVLVTGDLNAGWPGTDSPAPAFFCSEYFDGFRAAGYSDLWRAAHGAEAKEYTWLGQVNPYRLDHAFGSRPVLDRLTSCGYDHSVREAGISDHSLLSISLHAPLWAARPK